MNFSKNTFKVLFRKQKEGKIRKGMERKEMMGKRKGEVGMDKGKYLSIAFHTNQNVFPFYVYLLAIILSLIHVNHKNL